MNLSSYALNIGLVLDLVFLKDFDRYFFARNQVRAQPHLTEGALSK